MFHTEVGLLAGAVALGTVHGMEPGHGWPVAATYALDRTNKWVYGFAASLIIGVGHLVSSLAMVAAFFYAKAYFDLAQLNDPIVILGDVRIGGPVSLVAGLLLVVLGVREYRHGHSHGHRSDRNDRGDHHGTGHRHRHGTSHPHRDHGHARGGLRARLGSVLPFADGHSRSHASPAEAADRSLVGIAWFAFVLGFAHEEEFEIIALCAGSNRCLELMGAYALAVVVGIVGLTMLLIAGYTHFGETAERYTPYLPALSAAVLVVMGIGFIVGLL